MFFFLVAVAEANYTYIVGVDRTNVLLLCDPKDGDSLSMLRWSEQGGMEFFNPINLNSERINLPDTPSSFSCLRDGYILITSVIYIEGNQILYVFRVTVNHPISVI